MRLYLLALALALLGSALAQREVRLDLKAFRVVSIDQGGRVVERLEPALEVRPGQLIEYQLSAQNTTDKPLRQVALVIPVPKEAVFQGAFPLEGARLEFSYDGGRTYGQPPLKRKVRMVEGGREVEKEVEVKPEEYTHARWTLPELGAQQTVFLRLRAVVR
ncbi:MAG: hypothetical protein NZ849_07350 [Meiothermus sp.]|uniref:hypothetical protein n=1 Tax=Meiothermus sp. TaxID=1955249 RepID=UPI0025D962F7|nr:hypothetical protein [Meiothermus sp.]MCS7058617.1 hypothetical protein [Meiothermus sp.]MCS7194708.1 hypothetical protein [Meiothermus sp.]MCX7739707.1 hypothetical protein [Meiothermus sp.]MDW8090549.1 hypothetical protein [Meiothermus sp.]MDW8482199.1 hypothetical protein [Meiothermus sp.]